MSKRNTLKRFISSPLVQAFLIYVSGGWIVLEMADFLISNYSLNGRIRDVLLIIFVAGLPVTLLLAWYLSREKEEEEGEEHPEQEVSSVKKSGIGRFLRRKPWISLSLFVLILLLLLTGGRYIRFKAKARWAREEAMPMMQDRVHDWEFVSAFQLREEVKKYLQDDPAFLELDSSITRAFTILTEPEGAEVYYKAYPDLEGEWQLIGTTPVRNFEMPSWTMFRWKFTKPGYEEVNAVVTTYGDTLFRTLHREGEIPEGMVYVEGLNDETAGDFGSEGKHGFFIDRYEVTNLQYKEFMDRGGYQDPQYWHYPVVRDNDTLSFEEALALFADATGRPGPAGWEAGDYPDGYADYPVNGISWYEAAAYTAFAGKTLPTMDHWRSAAGLYSEFYETLLGSNLIPLSNMGGDGPEPVGSNPALNCFGTYDLSGNVREWCWNRSPAGRIIQGGAWNDATYMSTNISQLPALDRSLKNGFRCVLIPEGEGAQAEAYREIEIEPPRDYYAEEPVTEFEFQLYKKQFLYDRKPMNGLVDERDESNQDWILEKVSFDAAYEDDRVIAYLFLPRNAAPPYQTLVYFPGSNARSLPTIFDYGTTSRNLNYILKNGRAVIFPIYLGTFERRYGSCSPRPEYFSHQYTECLSRWIKDLSRSLDYLETRSDIDTSRIGYLGDSWGSELGPIATAVDDRIKLTILLRGGFDSDQRYPEADEFCYIPFVHTPVLMINGRYDFEFNYDNHVKPMFDLLGTPDEDKKLVICETDHFIPKTVMIREVLDWLDRYFGPVKR